MVYMLMLNLYTLYMEVLTKQTPLFCPIGTELMQTARIQKGSDFVLEAVVHSLRTGLGSILFDDELPEDVPQISIKPHEMFGVAYCPDEITGRSIILGAIAAEAPKGSPTANLTQIMVHPQRRRQGVGTFMYRSLEDRLRVERGVRNMTAKPKNEAAVKFLARLGFGAYDENAPALSLMIKYHVGSQSLRAASVL